MTVYLSLGSNLGNREDNLRRAIDALPGVTKVSHDYETEPADVPGQPWFLNCAVEMQTDLSPHDLLRVTQAIEQSLGRERIVPKGPRTIDIDILFYGDSTIATPDLQIPHPRLHARRFVLEPLCEIAPRFAHLLARLDDPLIVRKAS